MVAGAFGTSEQASGFVRSISSASKRLILNTRTEFSGSFCGFQGPPLHKMGILKAALLEVGARAIPHRNYRPFKRYG